MRRKEIVTEEATTEIKTTMINSKNSVLSRDLKIVSWNIHGLMRAKEGLKSLDEEFTEIIDPHKIFCLQETKREVVFPNYRCFNKLRKGSKSGGLCIGIHRSLSEGVKEVETGSEDIIAIKLSIADLDGRPLPLFIVNIYDSPEASSYKMRTKTGQSVSTLQQVLDFFNKGIITQQDKVILTGDFNARTGGLNHTPCCQTDTTHRSSGPVNEIERASQDQVLNARGKLLIDSLASTDLSLLNGCTLGDVMGDHTCHTYNGASVVDYTAVSQNLQKNVQSFTILPFTSISDHRPSSISLGLLNTTVDANALIDSMEPSPNKHKWESDNPEMGKQFLNAQLQEPTIISANTILLTNCKDAEDVIRMNDNITEIYNNIADEVIPIKRKAKPQKVNSTTRRIKPKQCWFDTECINKKRKLRSLAKRLGKTPTDTQVREDYFLLRRCYRGLINTKKTAFIASLSQDIALGTNINWKRFNQLKQMNSPSSNLDVFDMRNFVEFFKDLYRKKELPDNTTRKIEERNSNEDAGIYSLEDSLNLPINTLELKNSIKSLKNGKAVAEDLVANEFLKNSSETVLAALLHLFNECLRLGVYPWSTSVVTPLHKKGSVYDPNNYRAIAVSSNLGKLFSNILLARLIKFRSTHRPDTANQLGFCKNAQTADHALTLHTTIEKYVKIKRVKLYTCFVDFAKAFDTVSREALLYKLWSMGVRGKFYNCLEYMYSRSTAKVKLLSKLSERIDILVGTEQGHPMSPELFKCYIHELSEELNSLENVNIPDLAGRSISHLLWADDLVLMALDGESLDVLLEALFRFCSEWGLTVNTSKTAVMVFNVNGRLLKESHSFTYGSVSIPTAREYCYLGIVFTVSGSMTVTQQKLKQKAFRAYFSLKSSIDMRAVSKLTLFQLFDALIHPVASYGSPVWLPSTNAVKAFVSEKSSVEILKLTASDPLERIHLTFLKWTLGVGTKTSNCAVWGDSGRIPLALSQMKQVFQYVRRLSEMLNNGSPCLARFAFEEQCKLQLPWFKQLSGIYHLCTGETLDEGGPRCSPSILNTNITKIFVTKWEDARNKNGKLGFYNTIKPEFGLEAYLWPANPISSKEVKRIAQLRSSSHMYGIETGRWGQKRESINFRLCPSCCDVNETELLAELPFFEPIIEDEYHVLRTCPAFHDIRLALSDNNKTCLFANIGMMFHPENVQETARYARRIHDRRYPKESKPSGTKKRISKD